MAKHDYRESHRHNLAEAGAVSLECLYEAEARITVRWGHAWRGSLDWSVAED